MGGVFFIIIKDDITYLWEDGLVEFDVHPQWCEAPFPHEEFSKHHPCSKLTFLLLAGEDFDKMIERDKDKFKEK